MEGLAPPLKCLIEIQSAIASGEPVRAGLSRYLQQCGPQEEFPMVVRQILFAWDQGDDWRIHCANLNSPYRRSLLEVVACGFAGQPISSQLEELRIELCEASELEIKHQLEMLPLRMLIPLLMFQFPAFLLLLFGPLLRNLVEELNR